MDNMSNVALSRAEKLALLKQRLAKSSPSKPTIPTIKKRELSIETGCALSFAQQRLWLIDQMDGGSAQYHMSGALNLAGRLDVNALEQAFNEIISRHESLRTCFIERTEEEGEAGQPLQFVQPAGNVDIAKTDLSTLDKLSQASALTKCIAIQADKRFDLRCDLMLRAQLICLSAHEHVLLTTMHHIASDGWSMAILINEFSALYRAYCQGEQSPLGELTIQYADYAQWQRQWLQGQVLDQQLNYWEKQLANLPVAHRLPLDNPRPTAQSFVGATHRTAVSFDDYQALKTLCQHHGATLFMGLHAAFSVLLSRYSNESDIVVGSPIANREQAEVADLIGFFVNTLVLRSDLSQQPSFNALLKQSKQMLLDAYAHQQVPFEQIVERLKPTRNLAHSPLFQVMLVLQNNQESSLKLPDLTLSSIEQANNVAKYDLTLSVEESAKGLSLYWEYNSDIFNGDTIARMAGSFAILLRHLVTSPELNVFQHSILTALEVKQQLVEWNKISNDFSAEHCIHHLFEEQVKRTPDTIAVVFEEQAITYGDLNSKSNQLARYLIEHRQVKPDSLVGICVERSLDMVVSILAVLKAGGACVPLNPEYPKARLEYMIADASLQTVLMQGHIHGHISISDSQVVFVDDEVLLDQLSQKPTDDIAAESLLLHSKNLAYVIYTSGSTGQPKGVEVEHYGLVSLNQFEIIDFQLMAQSRVLHSYAFSFDPAMSILFMGLNVGAIVFLCDPKRDLSAFMAEHSITHTIFPSALLAAQQWRELPALEMIGTGGEHCPKSIVDMWAKNRRYFNIYGPTETTVTATHAVHYDTVENHSIGQSIANVECFVLNAEQQLVPAGCEGELYIGGVGLARGYLNRPDLTKQRFIQSPSMIGNKRLYRTGDLVRYINGGQLEYIGRIDAQVKIRGFRVELGEVEHELAQHAYVNLAVVLLREDTPGNKQLVAYVTLSEQALQDNNLTAAEIKAVLKSALSAKLPEHMVPLAIEIQASMPYTPNGKLDRRALPAPEYIDKERYITPLSTEIEQTLAHIWAELLGIDSSHISADDNFFNLGGHSLLIVRLVSAIREHFSVELSIKSVFETPILSALAENIVQANPHSLRPDILVVDRENQLLRASFSQQRLWFIDQMEGGSSHYNMPAVFQLAGRLNLSAAEQALQQIIDRHEVLRTGFYSAEQGVIQKIKSQVTFSINRVEIAVEEQGSGLIERIKNEVNVVFDLENDLMLKVSYFSLAADQGILIFNIHHIAADGWAMDILLQEFKHIYHAIVTGSAIELLPLTIQYADYAQWQHNWLAGEVMGQQLNYWQTQLNNLPLTHNLPLDFTRPEQQSFHGAHLSKTINSESLTRLKQLALEHGISLFMLLHGAFALMVSRHSNTRDIVIGTPVANRLQKELEPLVGCFINTLVLRLDCEAELSLADFLLQVKQVNLDAQNSQDIPFEHLVEHLNPQRNVSFSPLFQIMFTMNTNKKQRLVLPDVDFTPYEYEEAETKYDLTLNAIEDENGLQLEFEYNTELFKRDTIDIMAEHLVILLQAMLDKPVSNIAHLPLLTAIEQKQLLNTDAVTTSTTKSNEYIHELFEQQAAITPDAVAIVYEGQRLTYQVLNQKADQLACYLIDQGVVNETLVGIYLTRSPDVIISILAVLKAGAAFITLDASYPEQRLSYMLKDSSLAFVISQSCLIDNISAYQGHITLVDHETTKRDIASFSEQQILVAKAQHKPLSSNLAYVIYTSGSTGQPKGVEVEHRSLVNLSQFEISDFQIDHQSRLLHVFSFSFDPAISLLFMAFNTGATLYLSDTERNLSSYMAEHDISHVMMPAAVLAAQPWRELPSLKVIATGGEACPKHIVDLWIKNSRYYNLYGPTETTVMSTRSVHENTFVANVIGQPIANTQCLVLDQSQQLVPFGCEGELYIGGAGLARGYLNRAELTSERFISHPWQAGQRLYRTGDLVRYLSDGQLSYIGRIDAQIKIRGFRVELGEIEHELARHHEVKLAVVVLREDIPEQKRLVAYITLSNENLVAEEVIASLKNALSLTLPEHMVPTIIQVEDAIPRTQNGKIDRNALPIPSEKSRTSVFITPATETEVKLAKIWGELLNIASDNISADDNFFALGGHSLLSVRLASEINDVFNIDLSIKTIFEAPCLNKLASALMACDQSEQKSIPVVIPRTSKALATSYAQKRLWFLDQMTGDSSQYNMANAFSLSGTFDVTAAEIAFKRVIERHEPLRTVFISQASTPLQVIQEHADFALTVVDISQVASVEQQKTVQQAVLLDSQKSFDLAHDLMLRASVYILSEQEYVLLINVHHIACDGWSMGILISEFMQQYQSVIVGDNSVLPKLPLQYADYAHWQNTQLDDENLQPKIEFWLNKLQAAPQLHSLPLDYQRTSLTKRQGAQHSQQLSHELTTQLKQFSLSHQASLFMTMQSAFALHLGRWSNETDIVMGSPTAGREHKAFQSLIGLFLNTQIFRTDFGDNPSFNALVNKTREEHLLASSFNDVPFELLVEHLNPARSLTHTPIFQVLINMNNNPEADITLSALTFSNYTADIDTKGNTKSNFENKYDITLYINECLDNQGKLAIQLDWVYDKGLFNENAIANSAKEFSLLLTKLMVAPELPVLAHDWSIGAQWNKPVKSETPTTSKHIVELFELQALNYPNKKALATDGKHLTYKALNEQANKFAQMLQQQHGIQLNDRVALAMSRSVERIVAMLAILKLGAAYVPLTQELPVARLAMMLEDSEASLLLIDETSSKWSQELQIIAPTLVCDDKEILTQCLSYTGQNISCAGITDQTISHMIFTSGSTGRPKGVLGNHGALLNRVQWMLEEFSFTATETAAHITSMAFIRGVWELWVPLCSGVTLTLFDRDVVKDPKRFIEQLSVNSITRIVTAPSLMRAMTAYMSANKQANSLLVSQLKYWFVSGEALSSDLADQALTLLPKTNVINLYGSTEVLSDVLFYQVLASVTDHYVPLGQSISGVSTTLVDRSGSPVPEGVIGELVVVGQSVTLGYSGLDELTKQQFIQTPIGRGYRTGDLGRMTSQGNIAYIGRIDHQIKIRGYRVELSEIEFHLAQLNLIKDVVVVALGQQEKYLSAYFTLDPSVNVDRDNIEILIRTELKTLLPAYMVPSFFTLMTELPLTPNGKINRKALVEPERKKSLKNYRCAQSATEEILVRVWSQLLDIAVDKLSATANFFDLGGHSLLSIRLIAEVRLRCQKELTIRDVFAYPELNHLASYVDSMPKTALRAPVVKVARVDEDISASFSQQRLWFLDQMDGGSTHYNIPVALQISGDFSIAIAQQALNRIVARHEPLRTVFINDENGQAKQVIKADAEVTFEYHDVSQLSKVQQENRVENFINEDQQKAFNLTKDNMIRASYMRQSEQQGVLLLNVHHIAADGWSTRLIIKEFSQQYSAILSGEKDPLSPLDISYADYAHWQRHWLVDNVLEQQLTYWQQTLADLPQVHSLPLAQPRPSHQTFAGAEYDNLVSRDVLENLKQFALENNITLFMLLHGAFSYVLSRHSGESDVVLGTPVANRLQKELEPLVGFFVNTLVLRVNCAAELTLKEYLAHVKQINLDAQANQDTPFEHLVERLQPARTTKHSPLFQIMFSMDTNEQTELTLAELSLSALASNEVTAKFELTLNAITMEDGLLLSFEYNTALFEQKQIAVLAQHLNELLSHMAKHLDTPLAELPLLNEQEQEHLVVKLNPTQETSWQYTPLTQLISQQSLVSASNIAVICAEQQLSYRDLEQRSNQLAHYLYQQGVRADTLIGICVERSVEMLIGLLAILKSGGAYVPLDPSYPKARLAYMQQDSAMKWLLTQAHLDVLPENNDIHSIVIDDPAVEKKWQACSRESLPVNSAAQDLAYVIYTSGSTGQPKGVMLEHHSVSQHVQAMAKYLQLSETDHVLQFASMSFDTFVEQTFAALTVGACLHLRDDQVWSTDDFYHYNDKNKITVTDLSPAYLTELLRDNESATDFWQHSSLTRLVVGGEALLPNVLARWQALNLTKQCRLINAYGPTEATITSTVAEISAHTLTTPIGRSFAGRQLYVLDAHQRLVPFGGIGELYIAGYLARGYLHQPELTAERFITVSHLGKESIRLYRTGDRVRYLNDGQLTFIGRTDEQVKIRGFRVELGEIEQQICALSGVATVVVQLKEDDNQVKRLCAYLTLNEDSDENLTLNAIKAALTTTLPSYMQPSSYTVLSTFPLMPNGKIDKGVLPTPAGLKSDDEHQTAQGEAEQVLVQIWSDLLKIAVREISTLANFFSLGGDSILSMQLVSKAKQAGMNITVKDIFECQTIKALALKSSTNNSITAPQHPSKGHMTLLPIQHDFFSDEIDLHHFNQSVLLSAPKALTKSMVLDMIKALYLRHDALRLCFTKADDGWQARYQDLNEQMLASTIKHHVLAGNDFSLLTPIAEHAQQSLSLAQGPMFQVLYFTNNSDEVRLLVIIHHLLVDGVSWRILFEDLNRLSRQSLEGSRLSLADKTSSYQQWGDFLQSYALSDNLQAEREYWFNALALKDLPVLAKTADNEQQSVQLSSLGFDLTQLMTDQLLSQSTQSNRHNDVQTNELLLAAVWLGVKQWRGTNELQIDLEGHGREALAEHLDLSQTIGWFTSIYPLRLASTDDTLAAIIDQTTSTYRSIPNHGIGYGILKYLAKEPALQALPASEILFNYLGQFDQVTQNMVHLSVAEEDVGASMSPNRKQTHEFVINTLITSGTLKFELGFNVNQHSAHQIQQLLNHIKKALMDLILFCKNDGSNAAEANVLVNHTAMAYENSFDNIIKQDDLAACVMKLNQGNETRKIFCLHPLGGTVSSYVELANEVEEYAAFYGIQAPALTSSLRFSTIESLSQYYVQAIKAHQPNGPYIIIGWSLGGSLAYEVALQMQSQGEDIAYLGLLDEAPVQAPDKKADYCWYQRIKGLFEESFDWTVVETYDQDAGVNLLAEQAMINGFAPESVELEVMQRYFCYLADTSRALHRYTPKSSSLSLDLFKVNKPVKENNEQVDYGWSDISTGRIEILNVQGLHSDMVKAPHVQSLGQQLISRLANPDI